jgi:C4-dicarboxylate transporter DctM subunit
MIDPIAWSVFYLVTLIVLGFAGVHVATIMFMIAVVSALLALGSGAILNLGNLAWATQNDFILVSVPMFILLGEILLRSGISDRMYMALAAWTRFVPGGLLHTNVAASALFAATSGSSVATAATIGTVALPAFRRRRYDERWVLGSLAAGGTLGILIPPSINMIVYGAMTDTSIGRLFMAGVVPGLILTALFMLLIFAAAVLRPDTAGTEEDASTWRERFALLLDLAPPFAIFLVVMGSLYFGLATPTEAAALGVVAAIVLAASRGKLRVPMLHEAFKSTVRSTAMVMLVVVAAFFLNFVLSLLGVPQAIVTWVRGLGITPLQTIWLLFLIYLLLGCFLETLSMMVTTIPIVTPLVVSLGFDPVWFGIFLVLMAELALITPPVGMNLYVVQGIRGPGKTISDVIVGASPFAIVLGIMTALLIYVPELALWLPDQMYGKAAVKQ